MTATEPAPRAGSLERSIGFYGLLFVSLGSIIGSGWLLGALNAATIAGPASILSWILAACMLGLLALVYAELGAAYPIAGGPGRFAYYSHGPVAGFVAGWASWLQAVFIAPIEVLAAITYVDSVGWVSDHAQLVDENALLTHRGLVVAVILMIIFTLMNLAGAKFMSEGNSIVVIWKTAVPLLAIGVIASLSFHTSNFTAGGGFMPYGWHGVFAALPGGVVFALQGFEQAAQMAGEAKNPKRDLSRAILISMGIGALLYTLLQVVMIAGVQPSDVADGWQHPLGKDPSDYGAWYTLALSVGATWLATVLIIDAVVSPAGTGIVYVGTSARLSYALGEEEEMPSALASTRNGVPVVSILLAAVVGIIAFGPFKSWNSLVNVVTGATAIMYAFAPVALVALHRTDSDRPRPYSCPMPRIVLPAAFCSANLIIYWGGFNYTWKLACALVLGLVLFAIGSTRADTNLTEELENAWWIGPWIGGTVVIGALGRYGDGSHSFLPEWIDLLVVIAFSLAIFFLAARLAITPEETQEAIEKDAHQLKALQELA